jgi:hypothetical protein
MDLLTQTEVLKEINEYSKKTITKQAFYDRTKKGQIKIHYKAKSKKKFYKLNEVAKVYGIKIGEIESHTSVKIKSDETIFTSTYKEELTLLLKEVDTPVQKVAVIKDFWDGKLKELKHKEAKRELIPMHEALGVMQIAITNFKTKMYEIPHQLKAQYPDASSDMIDELHLMIDKAFYEFSKASIQQ